MSLWSSGGGQDVFAEVRGDGAHLAAVERLKDWTRERFALGREDTVLVAENPTTLPGCPPLQTVVAFWTADGQRHHFSAFKPVGEVQQADIPPAWLKAALALSPGVECACC